MPEQIYRVFLGTAAPDEEYFKGFLLGARIMIEQKGTGHNLVPCEYKGTKESLERLVREFFTTGCPEEDEVTLRSIEPLVRPEPDVQPLIDALF